MRFLSAVVRELDIVQAWLVPAAELVQKNLITCNPQGDVAERLGNDVHECQILSVLRDQVLVVRKIVLNKLARFMMYTMSSRSHLYRSAFQHKETEDVPAGSAIPKNWVASTSLAPLPPILKV